jgi:hypothetical protein
VRFTQPLKISPMADKQPPCFQGEQIHAREFAEVRYDASASRGCHCVQDSTAWAVKKGRLNGLDFG